MSFRISEDPSILGRPKIFVNPLKRRNKQVNAARKLIKALGLKDLSHSEWKALVSEAPV
jgi:hypothetical protein